MTYRLHYAVAPPYPCHCVSVSIYRHTPGSTGAHITSYNSSSHRVLASQIRCTTSRWCREKWNAHILRKQLAQLWFYLRSNPGKRLLQTKTEYSLSFAILLALNIYFWLHLVHAQINDVVRKTSHRRHHTPPRSDESV